MICKNCGKEIENGGNFCPYCGFDQRHGIETNSVINEGDKTTKQSAIDSYKMLVNAYITKNSSGVVSSSAAEHYYSSFLKLQNNPSAFTWNWGAFVFGVFNMFYRKAYKLGLIYIGVVVLVCIIGAYLGFEISGLLVWCASATFADRIHFHRFKEKLSEAQQSYPNDISNQCQYLANC